MASIGAQSYNGSLGIALRGGPWGSWWHFLYWNTFMRCSTACSGSRSDRNDKTEAIPLLF